MSDDTPRLVNSATAARALGVSGTTLRRWAEAGRVRPASTTLGGHARWDLDDLRRQIERARNSGEDWPEDEHQV